MVVVNCKEKADKKSATNKVTRMKKLAESKTKKAASAMRALAVTNRKKAAGFVRQQGQQLWTKKVATRKRRAPAKSVLSDGDDSSGSSSSPSAEYRPAGTGAAAAESVDEDSSDDSDWKAEPKETKEEFADSVGEDSADFNMGFSRKYRSDEGHYPMVEAVVYSEFLWRRRNLRLQTGRRWLVGRLLHNLAELHGVGTCKPSMGWCSAFCKRWNISSRGSARWTRSCSSREHSRRTIRAAEPSQTIAISDIFPTVTVQYLYYSIQTLYYSHFFLLFFNTTFNFCTSARSVIFLNIVEMGFL